MVRQVKTMIDEKKLIEDIEKEFDGVCSYDVSPSRAVQDFTDIVDRQPKVGVWIPVSERLPKPNKAVLICTNTGEIEVDYYGSCTKGFIGLKGTHMKALAWQPLPEPYKAGEQE